MESTIDDPLRQLPLPIFGAPPRPKRDRLLAHNATDTSIAAAEHAAPTAKSRRAIILALIVGEGDHGATADELGRATGWPSQSVTARVNELLCAGLIADSGARRETQFGRMARVNVCTAEGRREARR